MTGALCCAGLGFGVTLGTVIISESGGSLAEPGGLLTAAGRLAGFTGAYLMLIMVVLVARLPWLEVSAGQDQLIRWHRRVAPWAFGLITAHVVLVTLGYAQAAQVGIASIDDGGMQRSQFIDEQAIPILEQEAMQAQSASIQGVSGASYTSAGFQQSLQAALQTLGFK